MNNLLHKLKSLLIITKNRFFAYKSFLSIILFLGFSFISNISSAHTENTENDLKAIAWDIHDVAFQSKGSILGTFFNYIKALKDFPFAKKTRGLIWEKLKGNKSINSAEIINSADKEGLYNFKEFLLDRETNWTPNEEVFNVIKELNQTGTCKQYICSNISDKGLKRLKQLYPEHVQYFDGEFTSTQGSMKKPNPIFFQQFLNKFNLKAEQVLFIDDSKSNCESAETLGMNTIIFENVESIQKIYNLLSKNFIKTITI